MVRRTRCYGTAVPWLVFTNLYVALCGAALTAATATLLGEPIRLDAIAGLVFCCTLVIYNLDRLVEPNPGDSVHEQWVESHRRWLWLITAAGALGAVAFWSEINPAAQASLPIAGAIAIGYCLPVVPRRGRWLRLKAMPGAKLILIALVWTYATAGLPMLHHDVAPDGQAIAIVLARFFFIAAVALPFDLPDMQRDRQAGIDTVPIVFGADATKRIAWGLCGISTALAIINPWPAASALLVTGACLAGLIAALRPDRGVAYFTIALDGTLLLKAGLLICVAG